MSYAFDADSGETRASLVDLVVADAFSVARYTPRVQKWLNDAVTDVCRKLRMQRGFEVVAYDSAGVVAQPALPFFRVDEVWTASAGADESGEQAFLARSQAKLDVRPERELAGLAAGNAPVWYSTRRVAQTGRIPQLEIVALPAAAPGGMVAISGLQRPAAMDDDDDVSGLGGDLDDALVAYAKARCFRNEDDFEMHDRWQVVYEQELRSVIHLDESGEPKTTRGTDC